MILLFVLLAAAAAQAPQCIYTCNTYTANATCVPTCQKPQCRNVCLIPNTPCNPPRCDYQCSQVVNTSACPVCETYCEAPQCSGTCEIQCDPLNCSWSCSKPATNPECQWLCEHPECEGSSASTVMPLFGLLLLLFIA